LRRRGALIIGNGTFDWSRRRHPVGGKAIDGEVSSMAQERIEEAALNG
jgi:hypothetical protein